MTGYKTALAPTKDVEMILPSGTFARVRPITVEDMGICGQLPHFFFMAALAARIPEQVLAMDYDEAAFLFAHINRSLLRAAQIAHGHPTT